MTRRQRQNPKDILLLSAYLDGQLSPAEISKIEHDIASDESALNSLELLRQTRNLLKLLPVRKAPRNFTLRQKPAQQFSLPSFAWVTRFASVTAAVLLLASFLINLPQQPSVQMAAKTAPELTSGEALQAPAAARAADVASNELPDIIYWGGPPLAEGAFGKGGGGAEGPGIGGGAPAAAIPQILEAPVTEAMPQIAPESPAAELVPEVMQATAIPAEPLTGSEPVLGIAPTELRGQADVVAKLPDSEKSAGINIDWTVVRWLLAGLLLVTAIPGWVLRRK